MRDLGTTHKGPRRRSEERLLTRNRLLPRDPLSGKAIRHEAYTRAIPIAVPRPRAEPKVERIRPPRHTTQGMYRKPSSGAAIEVPTHKPLSPPDTLAGMVERMQLNHVKHVEVFMREMGVNERGLPDSSDVLRDYRLFAESKGLRRLVEPVPHNKSDARMRARLFPHANPDAYRDPDADRSAYHPLTPAAELAASTRGTGNLYVRHKGGRGATLREGKTDVEDHREGSALVIRTQGIHPRRGIQMRAARDNFDFMPSVRESDANVYMARRNATAGRRTRDVRQTKSSPPQTRPLPSMESQTRDPDKNTGTRGWRGVLGWVF